MTTTLKTLFAGAAVLSALAMAAPASAVTIVTPFSTGPFDLNNPLGTIPATKLQTGNVYDFSFTLDMPTGSSTSVQLSSQLLKGGGSTPELIQYSLYSGVSGSGTFISQSSLDFSPTIAFTPTVGDYYVEVNYIAASGEVAGGTLTASVPEPASWAMMLVGFGALGVALRRRAAKAVSASV